MQVEQTKSQSQSALVKKAAPLLLAAVIGVGATMSFVKGVVPVPSIIKSMFGSPQADVHSVEEYKKMPQAELKALQDKISVMARAEREHMSMEEMMRGYESDNTRELDKIGAELRARSNKEQGEYLMKMFGTGGL